MPEHADSLRREKDLPRPVAEALKRHAIEATEEGLR